MAFLARSLSITKFNFGFNQLTIRHGSNLKETKNRIKSVKAIQKITKTMKMIASARLRGAQNRLEESRPFGVSTTHSLNKLSSLENKEGKNLLILISSDRGLCGSINSQVVKVARGFADTNKKTDVALLGDKGVAQFSRTHPQTIIASVQEFSKGGGNFFSVSLFIDTLLSSPEGKDYDNIYVLYNKFNSLISFTPVLRYVPSPKTLRNKVEEGLPELVDYEFEDDDVIEHLNDLAQYHLASTVFSAYLENQTSELGARMSSMDTATTNATDMIKRLSIKYNRGRQAAITTELTEIISGSEALKGEKERTKKEDKEIDYSSLQGALEGMQKYKQLRNLVK